MIIRYFGPKGQGKLELDPDDNPLSPSFVPLEERSRLAQVRWWAKKARVRDARSAHGVFDPPPRK